MEIKLFYAFLLTVLPVSELRGGLPVGIFYALNNGIPVWLIFLNIVFLNILLVFLIFLFLDRVHKVFMNLSIYNKLFSAYVARLQKRINRIKESKRGIFFALLLFVALPFPGTGAYTGCLVSWILGLERKKSVLAISVGILIAGILVLLASLEVISFFV